MTELMKSPVIIPVVRCFRLKKMKSGACSEIALVTSSHGGWWLGTSENPRSLPSPKTREGGISYFDIIGSSYVSVTMTPSVSDEGE